MSITNTALAQAMADLVAHWQDVQDEFQAWIAGAVDGGPSEDGKFPLTDYLGVTRMTKSPARLEEDVENIVTGAIAYAEAADEFAQEAATSAASASTHAGNASGSASAASGSASAASGSASAAASSAATAVAQASAASASASAALAAQLLAQAAAGALTDPGFDAVMTWDNTANVPVWSALSGFARLASSNTFNGTQIITGSNPDLMQVETGVSANNSIWAWGIDAGVLRGRIYPDDFSSAADWVTVTRSGATVSDITLSASAIHLNGVNVTDFARISTGTTFATVVKAAGAGLGMMGVTDTTADADEKMWEEYTLAGQLVFRTANDAYTVHVPWMTVQRDSHTPTHVSWLTPTSTIPRTLASVLYVTQQYGYHPGVTGTGAVHMFVDVISGSLGRIGCYDGESPGPMQLFGSAFHFGGSTPPDFADDAAAAAGGVAPLQWYRTGSILKMRVT